jgi:hypothetical protein
MRIQTEKPQNTGAYEIIPAPENCSIMPVKCVFDIKAKTENVITQFRARWVVCGNHQQPGVNFDLVYSPVVVDMLVKLFLSLVALKGLKWEQFGIITAYLHAELSDRKLYMIQPVGFEKADSKGNRLTRLLRKALYSLKQSGILWNNLYHKILEAIGFIRLAKDACLYTDDLKGIILILYVDDAPAAAPNDETLKAFLHELSKHFKMKILGEPFLGYDIRRGYIDGTTILSYKAYVEKINA